MTNQIGLPITTNSDFIVCLANVDIVVTANQFGKPSKIDNSGSPVIGLPHRNGDIRATLRAFLLALYRRQSEI